MANEDTRISRGIKGFANDIKKINAYLNAPSPLPSLVSNGIRLGILPEEITQWGEFYHEWEPLFPLYTDKKVTRTTNVKDQMMLIIKKTRAYEQKIRMCDRIAVCKDATTTDFEVFHIKRSTSLALTTHTAAPVPGTKTVVITLKKMGHLFHLLLITALGKEGRAKEAGVKEIQVYVAYTAATDVAPDLDAFKYKGDVSRGLATITHTDANLGQKAWYIARVKNTRGELGLPSDPVGFIVV